MYRVIITVIEVWVALNFAIPAFILYQRSPHFRHRLFDGRSAASRLLGNARWRVLW